MEERDPTDTLWSTTSSGGLREGVKIRTGVGSPQLRETVVDGRVGHLREPSENARLLEVPRTMCHPRISDKRPYEGTRVGSVSSRDGRRLDGRGRDATRGPVSFTHVLKRLNVKT